MDKLSVSRKGKSFAETEEYCKNNARLKLYPNGFGEWIPVEEIVSTRYIFNPNNVEYAFGKTPKIFSEIGYEISEEQRQADNKERAVRRAKARLYDKVRCNLDLCYFVTLTFSQENVNDRNDYAEIIPIVNQWLNNRVKRKNLKYVGVSEHHKKGGIHFHFLMNDKIDLVDSGTVKCNGKKKPIKVATADRYNIPLTQRKTVYNISDWHFGFSTAIEITNDERRVKTAHYLVKYLSKDFEKIGGRYYYSGGQLVTPRFVYYNQDFAKQVSDYEFEAGGAKFKVKKFE